MSLSSTYRVEELGELGEVVPPATRRDSERVGRVGVVHGLAPVVVAVEPSPNTGLPTHKRQE